MKKLVGIMVCVFFSVLFSGCNDDSNSNTVITPSPPTPPAPVVEKIGTIELDSFAGGAGSFDISWADDSGMNYLADANAVVDGPGTGHVDVFNALTDEFEYAIPGFAGKVPVAEDPTDEFFVRKSGPAGIMVIPGYPDFYKRELWAGDGNSTVKVVNLEDNSMEAISTGGNFRCDELSYDPKDHIIMVCNDMESAENSGHFQFATFIDQETHAVLGHIVYDGTSTSAPCAPGHGPKAEGLEQSVYDAPYFYLSVPATADNPGGEIDRIDPVTRTIVARFDAAGCHPSGLALGPNHHLVIGSEAPATIIMNDRDGSILAEITEVYNADQVWYSPKDMRYYIAAGAPGLFGAGPPQGVLGVIDAITNKWIQNLPTAIGSHSVAVNPVNNHIYVPNSDNNGIDVFALIEED